MYGMKFCGRDATAATNNSSLNFAARISATLKTQTPPLNVRGAFFLSFRVYISCVNAKGRMSAPVAASLNTAMKGVVSEQTRRKEDDCDYEFKGSPKEASRGTLQAGSARVRRSKGDDRI